jgi:hypothetical protein
MSERKAIFQNLYSLQIIVELNFILYDVDVKDKRGNRRAQGRDKDTRSKDRDRI